MKRQKPEEIKMKSDEELMRKCLKHTGWVYKDILYDNLKEKDCEAEICVCDTDEVERLLKEQKKEILKSINRLRHYVVPIDRFANHDISCVEIKEIEELLNGQKEM